MDTKITVTSCKCFQAQGSLLTVFLPPLVSSHYLKSTWILLVCSIIRTISAHQGNLTIPLEVPRNFHRKWRYFVAIAPFTDYIVVID